MVLGETDLARLDQPALLIWGENDPFGTLDQGKRIAEALNADFHLVDGGHAPWVNDPETVGRLTNAFLQQASTDRDVSNDVVCETPNG